MKLSREKVEEEINSKNWLLQSKDYINLKSDLEVVCPNGHLNVVSLERWRRNYICPICAANKYIKKEETPKKKKGYRILSFDQASITSGWSVFDDDELISYGKWTSRGNHSTERISLTKGWVASMIKKWQPDEVIFEDIQLQKFKDQGEAVLTYKKLAHLQGVLKNYCYESGIRYQVVPPATWRKYSEIKGKSRLDKKKNAQLKIKKIYDINIDIDIAEAILIGAWAVENHKKYKIIKF